MVGVEYGVRGDSGLRRRQFEEHQEGLERVGAAPIITSSSGDVEKADAIVLPGVGSFKSAMQNLGPVLRPLCEAIEKGRPF